MLNILGSVSPIISSTFKIIALLKSESKKSFCTLHMFKESLKSLEPIDFHCFSDFHAIKKNSLSPQSKSREFFVNVLVTWRAEQCFSNLNVHGNPWGP